MANNTFKAREGYYPNPVPLSDMTDDMPGQLRQLSRFVGEELEQIQAHNVGISGPLPLPIQATDALLIGRGDEVWSIDLWTYYFSLLAIAGFYGAPADIAAVTAIPTDITNWPNQLSSYHFDEAAAPDPVTGIITMPRQGVYRLSCKIIFEQPSTTQNFSYLLHVDASVQGNLIFDATDVATNQTDWRALGGSTLITFEQGEECKLQLSADGGTPGLADMSASSFDIELVAPTDVGQP